MKKLRFDVVTKLPNGLISIRKGPPLKQNWVSNTKVADRSKNASNSKLEAKSDFVDGKLSLSLPIRTMSEANCFENWRVKHARHKKQKRDVALALKPHASKLKLPCSILFTRFAPHQLDKHDNLPTSFKYIVDAVCAVITGNFVAGKADSDERISIAYDQVKSKEYGIKIEISY